MDATSKRIKLVISDFHLSRGKWLPNGRRNPLEDFHQDEKFKEFLEYYSTGSHSDADVELIINGDFFDPLAVIPIPETTAIGHFRYPDFPIEVEEDAAVDQFRVILNAHPISVGGMRAFLARGKKITIRWGNHDAPLLWPKVQELIRSILAPPNPEQLEFQKHPYIFDRICVDHGHQYEVINQFDENKIFIERETPHGKKVLLNLPFGSFFVLGFLNRIKLTRSYINQVYPFRSYLKIAMFFEPIFFIMNGFRVLWFFIKMRFITHPMRMARLRKTVMIIAEAMHRPSLEEIAEEIFTGPGSEETPFDILIMGHNHQAANRTFPGGKQYLNTGTWIPVTSLDMSTLGHRVLRTYALIEYVNGKPRATLKIWNGLPAVIDEFA